MEYLEMIEKEYSHFKNLNMQLMCSQENTRHYHFRYYWSVTNYDENMLWLELNYKKILGIFEEFKPDMILDFIDIGTDALAAADDDLTLNLIFTDHDAKYYVVRKAGVLLVYPDRQEKEADCTATLTGIGLLGIAAGDTELLDSMEIEGDAEVLLRLVKYMGAPRQTFNIIEP